jgi:hypothetical protein
LTVEKGFGGPGVKMRRLKMGLRVFIDAILNLKIRTERMTGAEMMGPMMN